MAKKKQLPNGVVPSSPMSSAPKSTIPSILRFPVLVLMSMTLSFSLYSITSDFSTGELSLVSNTRDKWWEIAGLLALKVAELAYGWWADYDSEYFTAPDYYAADRVQGMDIMCLTFMTHLPHLHLLKSFYNVSPGTILRCLAVDVSSNALPFGLLRKPLPVHDSEASNKEVANRSIINDWPIQIYTMTLAAVIYSVVIFSSLRSWLPVYFIWHFDGIKDMAAAHDAQVPILVGSFIFTIGWAMNKFMFAPSLGVRPDRFDAEIAMFDPETATFGETLWYNAFGYSKRSRTLIARTVTLAVACLLETELRTFIGVRGAEVAGGAGWGAVWATAALLTGIAFAWIGDVEGVSN